MRAKCQVLRFSLARIQSKNKSVNIGHVLIPWQLCRFGADGMCRSGMILVENVHIILVLDNYKVLIN